MTSVPDRQAGLVGELVTDLREARAIPVVIVLRITDSAGLWTYFARTIKVGKAGSAARTKRSP